MGKQTLDFESWTVPPLTVQPTDIVGLSFSELGHTRTISLWDVLSAINDVNTESVMEEDTELLHKAKAN